MVIYDIVNNLGFVLGVVVVVVMLSADGNSWPTLVALAGWYFLLAAVFALLSRGQTASYNRGTVLADGGGGS